MGMWTFRRKSKRRHLRSGKGETMHNLGSRGSLGNPNNLPEMASPATPPERRKSRKKENIRKSSKESKKLQRRRAYSFSPGRDDTIQVDRDRPPVPPLPADIKGKGKRRADTEMIGVTGRRNVLRTGTEPADTTGEWQRVPTLRKRNAQDLPRRKSSKKRKEEHDREAKIRAMVPLMPTRPATVPVTSGRPMKRESKKMHHGLNHHLQNPSSDISLPSVESLTSSGALSSMSDHQPAYVLSGLEMLAPRPTIRYSESTPRYTPWTSAFDSDNSDSRKRRVSYRIGNLEETVKANKRIAELADNFDASDLRELMERDQNRREKKQLAAKIKMERKLARRQEKQKAAETEAVRNGTPPPANMDRGVLGREVVGLGIGNSAVVTSSKRKGSDASDNGRGKRPADNFRQETSKDTGQPRKTPSPATEQFSPGSEQSDPMIETARVETMTKAISPPASPVAPANVPQMMDISHTPPVPEKATSSRRSSKDSGKATSSWMSFFKKKSKAKRGSAPPSFSNTSRDSMHSAQGPKVGPPPARLSTSNLPKRTMSRFREDLPETPISPPDSRLQSPEADVVPPIHTDYPEKKTGTRASSEDPRVRYDTPISVEKPVESTQIDETPTSGQRSTDAASPEPPAVLSQSLASIDSEGSWLSGRKGGSKRGSAQMTLHPLRDSAGSLQRRYKEYSESTEKLGIAEDEYFSRLSHSPDDQSRLNRLSAGSAGNPMPSSDEEDGGNLSIDTSQSGQTKWGAVAKTPTVVHHHPRAESREGLLNDFEYDSITDKSGETPMDLNRRSYGMDSMLIDNEAPEEEVEEGSQEALEGSGIQRATSIDYGQKHARHVSAGSARLLDLKPRSSVDSKRKSS